MEMWFLHIVSNDDFLLLHGVRVTRAETDKVLCSEVVRLSHHRRLLLPRHRHELECNQLTLTWKTHMSCRRHQTSIQVYQSTIILRDSFRKLSDPYEIHLQQKCLSPGSCRTQQWKPDSSCQQWWERKPPENIHILENREFMGLNCNTCTHTHTHTHM